jgi:WXXGXW repeat (2 copies)
MNRFPRFAPFALLALAVLISTAGCKSNPNANNGQNAADTGTQDASSDPASANLAPVSTTDSSAQAPADTSASSSEASDQPVDDSSYGEQPVATAPEPPPPLPEYQQPPAPGDDDLWTPGYWNYAAAGYYWVPGVWVQAPYAGALWTPPYWGWTGGHYGFYRGYWGPHIGFYGGVNYGFGYGGSGYQGGYWNSGHFFYNRSVNNINVNVVHNVYNYRVVANNNVRVSFNGGPGGLRLRPRPAELVALREPHAPPMRAQIEIEHTAVTNRAQFVAVNHGRPASVVIEKPLVADRDVHPVAPPAARYEAPRPEVRPNAPAVRPVEPARGEPARPAVERPAARQEVAPRPESHPQVTQPRPEERPAPHAEPARPAQHPPTSQARPEERPAPHAAPAKPAPHPPAKSEKPKPEEKRPE